MKEKAKEGNKTYKQKTKEDNMYHLGNSNNSVTAIKSKIMPREKILSRFMGVTIDEVWNGEWIY
jgi:hypothetical protein